MKKQKFELSHDIIAEKIWGRLPEQDRQLREIRQSIVQRHEDYQAGKGSLVGETEVNAWECYFSDLILTNDQWNYIQESITEIGRKKEAEKKEKIRSVRLKRSIVSISLVLASLITGFSIWIAIQQTKKVNNAISDQLVVEALHFDTISTALIVRKLQKALSFNPDNFKAKLNLEKYLNYLAKFEINNVLNYDLSKDGNFITILNKEDQKVRLFVYNIVKDTIILTKDINFEINDEVDYEDFYRLSNMGNFIACLNKFEDKTIIEVFDLDGKTPNYPIISTQQLGYSPGYRKSYQFSKLGKYITCLIEHEDHTTIDIFDLRKNPSEVPIISQHFVGNYIFSSDEKYLACLIKKEGKINYQVFDLNGNLPNSPIISTQQLNNDSPSESFESWYCFNELNDYFTCLIKQGNRTKCLVYNLKEDSSNSSITFNQQLRSSFSFNCDGSSYRFSEKGNYLTCFKNHNIIQVFNLNQNSSDSPIISKQLERGYRFSSNEKYLACVVEKDGKIIYQIFSLKGDSPNSPIISTQQISHDFSLRNNESNFRFSEKGDYFACLINKDYETICQVFDLQRKLPNHPIISQTVHPTDLYNSSYRGSYRFSKKGNFFACLTLQEGQVICQVFDIREDSPNSPIISTQQINSSEGYITARDIDYFNFTNSYRFSKKEDYFSCLIKLKDKTISQVYSLKKNQIKSPVFSSKELENNFSKEYYSREYYYLSDSYMLSNNKSFLFKEKGGKNEGILNVQNLILNTNRTIKDHFSINSYDITPDDKHVIYRTEDNRLKIVDITIPQEDLIDYYDGILPSLEELEKQEKLKN